MKSFASRLVGVTAEDVAAFHGKVLEMVPIPINQDAILLMGERHEWAVGVLLEEAEELRAAGSIQDQADALLDSIYFAVGRLVEMGVPFGPCWDKIHAANMAKIKGDKGRGSAIDAVKPSGWHPPDLSFLGEDLSPYLTAATLAYKKGLDYNQIAGGRASYFPFGIKSYAHEIHKKSQRLLSLAHGTQPTQQPIFESVADTYLDLINYAAFGWCAFRDDF